MAASRIVVIGSLNMDLVGCAPRIPVPGETITGHTYFSEPGGKGANQAYAIARLGASVAMLGRVGDDDFGRQMRANLAGVGCDVSCLGTLPGTSGIALIFVADGGQNSIIIVPGANNLYTPAEVTADAERHLHGAGWVLLQLENPLPMVLAAARAARAAGARVMLDPAPAPGEPLPQELLRLVDVLTPNETEAAILAGQKPGRLDPATAGAVARQLQARGAGDVVVKLGDQGCWLQRAGGGTGEHVPTPPVQAVDTTAAGDVFNAALSVALSEGLELGNACRFANQVAALSVTRMGAQACAPTRAEVESFAAQAAAGN